MLIMDTKHGFVHTIDFQSVGPSDKIVLCIHGFCCDARIFNYLATSMSEKGFHVKCIDLFGHGKSDGAKGNPEFDHCIEAIHEIVLSLKKKFKVYLLSHSMGCTFSLWYAHRFKNSIDGLILFAPYVRLNIKKRSDVEPNLLGFLYLLLRRVLTPNSLIRVTDALPNYLKVGGNEIRMMLKDPDLNFRYSYKYLIDTIALKNSRLSDLTDIQVPLLILHGTKDRQVFHAVGQQFFNLIQNPDKQFKSLNCDHWFFDSVFYDQPHDDNSEKDRLFVIDLLVDWLFTH